MFQKCLFIALIAVSLVLGATTEELRLEKAQKLLQSSDEIDQFYGYNECKAIYTQALSVKNSSLIVASLEGIIKGGELLHIDMTRYKTERKKYQASSADSVKSPEVVSVSLPKEIVEPLQKPLEFPKEYLKISSNNIVQASPKVTVPIALLPPITPPDVQCRLVDATLKDGTMELIFDSVIDPKEVSLSKIIESDKQRFRYIFDIKNVQMDQAKLFGTPPKIRLAQHDSKTLRIVVESTNALSIKPIYKSKSMFLDLEALFKLSSVNGTQLPVVSPVVTAPMVQSPLNVPPPPLVTLPLRDRSKKIIVIDPGHGGKDSGAVGHGHTEKEVVLQISLALAQRLRSLGYVVHLTRDNDFFVELKDRTRFANDKMSDLFLSIHANSIAKGSDANTAYGIETYFLSPGRSERAMRVAAKENYEDMGEMGTYGKLSFLNVLNSEKIIASNKLAIDIQKGVLNGLRQDYPNIKDNGAREAPFWVLVGAQMPAILLETGYISHPEESNRIADPAYQKEMIDGIVNGVKHYFDNNP